jgi:redox-sensitive bicupin YhaK (pirin superfamily)
LGLFRAFGRLHAHRDRRSRDRANPFIRIGCPCKPHPRRDSTNRLTPTISTDQVPEEKRARVILGSHGRAKSAILSPERINYLDVQLAAGERWVYQPPLDHEVASLAVSEGTIRTPEPVSAGEFVAFEESNGALVIHADRASRFVLGSAAKHPHELVLGQMRAATPAVRHS